MPLLLFGPMVLFDFLILIFICYIINTAFFLFFFCKGGPGCSSMEGATTENGPLNLLDIKEACSDTSCDYTGQFSANPYGWNKHANVLYVDQPRTVGYSFGYGSLVTSSVAAANDFVVFFNGWLEEFPEFKNRKVIISGESYGGHYIPAWSNAILTFNAANPTKPINLAGLVIGNGCLNNTVQDGTDVFVQFQHEQNLIPADSNPKTQAAAQSAMASYLGYTVNYYDYRAKSVTCSGCYGYDYRAWSKFFLQSSVKTALNVCGDAGNAAFATAAGGCVSLPGFDSNDKFDYSGAVARTLEAGIPVTFYYGKADTACNYVGGLAMANTISWKGTVGFQNAAFENIVIAGAEVGQVKSFGGLTFVQVESAGHMVPLDQPAGASYALQTLLSQL